MGYTGTRRRVGLRERGLVPSRRLHKMHQDQSGRWFEHGCTPNPFDECRCVYDVVRYHNNTTVNCHTDNGGGVRIIMQNADDGEREECCSAFFCKKMKFKSISTFLLLYHTVQ